jgi:hypothetical protein
MPACVLCRCPVDAAGLSVAPGKSPCHFGLFQEFLLGAFMTKLSFLPAALAAVLSAVPAFAYDQSIQVVPARGSDLQLSRLYSVDYKCRVNKSRVDGLVRQVVGTWESIGGDGVLNSTVTVLSMNAATAHLAAAAPVAGAEADKQPAANAASAGPQPVFSANVVTMQFAPAINPFKDTKVDGQRCSGQFFISGADNYRIDAQVGAKVTDEASKLFAQLATLTKTAATSMYSLFRVTKPVEFDASIEKGSEILTNYNAFRELFGADKDKFGADSGPLRVGTNWVYVRDYDGNVAASLELRVRQVVSLVADKHTKFLAAYNTSAIKSGITLSGDDQAMRKQCREKTQDYYSSGITDDRDIAFMLYHRLIVTYNSHQNIARCMGAKIARAAFSILNHLPKLDDEYRITLDDLKDLTVVSDQPHDRPKLADAMDSLVDQLDRHLQSEGLRDPQKTKLLGYFAPSVVVEDMTLNYRALKLLYPEVTDESSKALSRDDLLNTFRKTGLQTWFCVQRTKANVVAPALPLYDPDIDSAVMVIAAKAGANDTLDKNKSVLFGVHLKFDKAGPRDPLVINRMIFEERKRDIILKDNPRCIPDVGAKS